MLEISRRTMLAGTLASTPVWPLPNERPHMKFEDLVACAHHALELTEAEGWLVAQRMVWSTGGPRQLVAGVRAAIRASALMRGGVFDASHIVPEGALFALYDSGSSGGAWRPVAGGTVALCGVRMAAFTGHGRSACLVQSRGARIPAEIVLNG